MSCAGSALPRGGSRVGQGRQPRFEVARCCLNGPQRVTPFGKDRLDLGDPSEGPDRGEGVKVFLWRVLFGEYCRKLFGGIRATYAKCAELDGALLSGWGKTCRAKLARTLADAGEDGEGGDGDDD